MILLEDFKICPCGKLSEAIYDYHFGLLSYKCECGKIKRVEGYNKIMAIIRGQDIIK